MIHIVTQSGLHSTLMRSPSSGRNLRLQEKIFPLHGSQENYSFDISLKKDSQQAADVSLGATKRTRLPCKRTSFQPATIRVWIGLMRPALTIGRLVVTWQSPVGYEQ